MQLKELPVVLAGICVGFFTIGEYNKADQLMYGIKEQNYAAEREDMKFFATLFHLLIMYEMKDWHRFYNACEAAYRQFYKLRNKRIFEKQLMLFFEKTSLYNSCANN